MTFSVYRQTTDTLVVEGDLNANNAELLAAELERAGTPEGRQVTLILHDLDIDDGVANACVVNAVRRLLNAVDTVTLVGAPQVLAHVLYRVGDLEGRSRIRLVDTRQDEPYG